jgi:hypothetical protein
VSPLLNPSVEMCTKIALFLCKVFKDLRPVYKRVRIEKKFVNKELLKYVYSLSTRLPMISLVLDKRIDIEFGCR